MVQQAVVAAAAKAFRQHVNQQQAQEVDAGETANVQRAGLGVAVAETHVVVAIDAEDIGLAEHAAVEVAREVGERLFAIADTGAARWGEVERDDVERDDVECDCLDVSTAVASSCKNRQPADAPAGCARRG